MSYNEKQLAIIETAEKLFARQGFDGTSVRDIAQEAGINLAMISYYFGSKEKLLEAVFEQKTTYLKLKMENLIIDNNLSPIQKIYVLIDDYIERYYKQSEFHKVVLREQIMEKNNAIYNAIIELKLKNLEFIKLLINEGQKVGAFKKNIDVVLMVTTMIGTVSHMATSLRFYKEANHLENLTEQEVTEHSKKNLRIHLKKLFKALLTYEENK